MDYRKQKGLRFPEAFFISIKNMQQSHRIVI